ncbi:MAG TPA: ABC transporter substrate-binding protein [Microbacteriaceae bacterium]|nr:ABC transporter substrate-binding protein [Microbacteriaceae bacterium]
MAQPSSSRTPYLRGSGGRQRRLARMVVAVAVGALLLGAQVGVAGARDSARGATPKKGGTLRLLGTSDIFNLDTVNAYYTVSSLLERTFTRQLVSYANAPAFLDSIKIVADVASTVPTKGKGISADGKTYTFTLRPGVQWNSSPVRAVTAADFVREFKMLCNPAAPNAAPGYFTSTIVGMKAYCDAFAKVKATAPAIAAYVDGHPLAGVVAKNRTTLVFTLTSPAPDFLNILAMGFCSARPVEYMKYIPDGAQMRQHTLSDGPYAIKSYVPTKSFALARNPAWNQSSDPLRHAYVDAITVTEGLSSESVQQQLEAGTGDIEWDIQPPTQDVPRLISANDKNLILGPVGPYDVSTGYYITMNEWAGSMKNKLVRQAVATAVNKNSIVQISGGPKVNTVANQMILPGNVGYVKGFNAYPANTGAGNPAASKALLKKAGFPNGLSIKLLENTADPGPRIAQSIQSSLNAGGFKVTIVPATQADFYGKYLTQPQTAKRGVWDIAAPGWIPDWFGNNGRSTLQPIMTQPGPGASDYAGYNSPVVTALIDKALTAPSQSEAAKLWSQASIQTMKDAATVPLNAQKWPVYHSSKVQGCNFFFYTLSCDPTNVWLQ